VTVVEEQRVLLNREVRHDEVHTPVLVITSTVHAHPRTGNAIFAVAGPGEGRLLPECAVSVIDKETVWALIIGNEEVDPPIAVIVGAGDPQRMPGGALDAALPANIGQGAVAIVPIQA